MSSFVGKVGTKITLQVINKKGDILRECQFSNIVTNVGLQEWSKNKLGTMLAIGTGAGAEEVSRSSLIAYVRSATGTYTTTETNAITSEGTHGRFTQRLYVLFPAEVSARNYSEIGIHSGDHNSLQTYARIRGESGEPTTVSVLAGEQVRIYYDISYSHPLVSPPTTHVLFGVSTQVTKVLRNLTGGNSARLPYTGKEQIRAYEGNIPLPNAFMGVSGGIQSTRDGVITNGLFTYLITEGDWNFPNGIGLIVFGDAAVDGVGTFLHFDPPLQKVSSKSLRIDIENLIQNWS